MLSIFNVISMDIVTSLFELSSASLWLRDKKLSHNKFRLCVHFTIRKRIIKIGKLSFLDFFGLDEYVSHLLFFY